MTIDQYYKSLGWRLISDYGSRQDPFTGKTVTHNGIDFGVPDRSKPYNNDVKIPWGGVVRAVRNYTTTRGLTVSVKVDNSNELVLFQHLASSSLKAGDRVRANDTVGIAGTTGRSTGIHLHFEVRVDDGSAIGSRVWGDPKQFNPEVERVKTIVLSAGHGGRDPGASYHGVREKDVNLAVALACRDRLEEYYTEHRLILPRSTDVYVSLPARRDLTRKVGADLYVSMHHDAYRIDTANGFSTFVHSGPLFETTINYQKILHETVYKYMQTIGVRDRGMRRHNHDVTRMMPCPTVLMEYMFLSNPREARLASDPEVQKNIGIHTAEGIARALSLPGRAVSPTQPAQPTQPKMIPEVLRQIGIRIEGRQTDHEAWLLRGQDAGTFGRLHDILNDLGYRVEPHGNHVNIVKK